MNILQEIDDEQDAIVKELQEMYSEVDTEEQYKSEALSQLVEMIALCHVFIHKSGLEHEFEEFLNEVHIEIANKSKEL